MVTFVEQDRRTSALVRDNARTLGFTGVEVVAAPVARALATPPRAPYDVVFLDPPYALAVEDVEADLAALRDNGWLAPGALVMIERGRRGPAPAWPEGMEADRDKRYGETVLWYGHAAPNPPDPHP